jgi:hypothetical protein
MYHIPDTVCTGTATNYTNLNILNAGAAGTGTTEVANIDYLSGTATAELDARTFTSFVAFNVAALETIALQYEKVATGLLIPAGAIVIGYQPM